MRLSGAYSILYLIPQWMDYISLEMDLIFLVRFRVKYGIVKRETMEL